MYPVVTWVLELWSLYNDHKPLLQNICSEIAGEHTQRWGSTYWTSGLELVSLSGLQKGRHDYWTREAELVQGHQGMNRALDPRSFMLFPPGLMAGLWGQVQLEVQKKWRQWHLPEFPLCPSGLSNSFSNGTSGHTHSTKASPSEPSPGTCRASVI